MKISVLDSWAILGWITGQQSALRAVRQLLAEAEHGIARLFMSAINVGEVYYVLRKQQMSEIAESWYSSAPAMPVTIEVPTMNDIWTAARLKASFPIAYADAFAAALAQKHD